MQIVENLEMKKVPDNVKHRFLDETARSCVQTGPLLLEYKPALQEDENESKILLDEFEYSSEYSAKLGEEVIYLDDIEEFKSAVIKNGNLQDQRCFVFKSRAIDIDGEETASRKSWRKRSRRRSLHQESLTAAYYGESDETSPEIRRKSRHHRVQQSRRRDEEREVSGICKKCSLAKPCYCCNREVNKAVEAEEFEKQSPLLCTVRAMTMPCERPKDSNATDNIGRSNSFPFSQSYDGYSPCRHIHPKLPDYDELAAKFMELKRENLQKK